MPKGKLLPTELHIHFSIDPNPSPETIQELANHFHVTKQQVLRFFQNKQYVKRQKN